MLTLLLATALFTHLDPLSAGTPNREPELAVRGSMVGLAFGSGNAIYFALSHDSGRSFSAPVRVAEESRVLLSHHRGPRVVFSGHTIVITAVAMRGSEKLSQGDLLAWHSTDDGKTWSSAVAVNDVPGAAAEGLHALAVDSGGRLFAVWLDHHGPGGKTLYGAQSSDHGATWSKNTLVYRSPSGSICQCCSPSAIYAPGGRLLVMWRNLVDGNRDLYFSESRDGETFSKAEKLGTGSWPLNACPMDGGGIAVDRGRVITAWRRGSNVFLDEAGKPETQIGTGKDVALAVSHGQAFVAWSSPEGITLWHNGKTSSLAPHGAFPALTALPAGGVLVAWEENGSISLALRP